jgi:hypothetical protein
MCRWEWCFAGVLFFILAGVGNALVVQESKLVFSKAEMPDMSKCLAPAEEAKTVFRLRGGFIWYWIKLKDYVHDKKITIRVWKPM